MNIQTISAYQYRALQNAMEEVKKERDALKTEVEALRKEAKEVEYLRDTVKSLRRKLGNKD